MRKIRVAESILKQARQILDQGNKILTPDDIQMREALAIAASTLYFSIFQSGALSRKLSDKAVFNGNPEALERHRDWKLFRDKRFNHIDAKGRSIDTALIVDPENEFLDVVTLVFDLPVGQNHQWLQILYQLICHTLEHLDSEAEKTFQAIRMEVEGMTKEEISELPELTIETPSH
jgi:hypothetical protein